MLYLLSSTQLEQHTRDNVGYLLLFLRGSIATIIAYAASHLLFKNGVLTVTLFLTTIQLYDVLHYLLAKNHKDISSSLVRVIPANLRLVLEFFAVFLGVFATLIAAFLFFSETTTFLQSESLFTPFRDLVGTSHDVFTFPNFSSVFLNNLQLFLLFFLFSIIFRLGVIFVLTVNATIWASIIVTVTQHGTDTLMRLFKTLIIITPHMLLEVSAYIFCTLAGIFLSKALSRYHLLTINFFRPAETSLILLLSGFLLLTIGSIVESVVAPLIQSSLL